MVMLTHKLRMSVRTKKQREALSTALETSRLLYDGDHSDYVRFSKLPFVPSGAAQPLVQRWTA